MKSNIEVLEIKKLRDYKKYSKFIYANFGQVSHHGKIIFTNGIENFKNDFLSEIEELDKDIRHPTKWEDVVYRFAFWKNIIKENQVLFILKLKNNVVGFAVFEKRTNFLRYLYIDTAKQRQGIGSYAVKYFYELFGSYRTKIDEEGFEKGIQNFYISNGFEFLRVKPWKDINFYEYVRN